MNKRHTRKEAGPFLTDRGFPISSKTLQKYATTGGGPEYELFGNKALYQEDKLLAWAEAKLSAPRRSTSDPL